MTKEDKRKKGLIKVYYFDKKCECSKRMGKDSIRSDFIKTVNSKDYMLCNTCNCSIGEIDRDSVYKKKIKFHFDSKYEIDERFNSLYILDSFPDTDVGISLMEDHVLHPDYIDNGLPPIVHNNELEVV